MSDLAVHDGAIWLFTMGEIRNSEPDGSAGPREPVAEGVRTLPGLLHMEDFSEQLDMNGGPPPPNENGAIRPKPFALAALAGYFPSRPITETWITS
jgi:hypothetical protein